MRKKSFFSQRIIALMLLLLLFLCSFTTSAKQAKKATRPPKDEVENIRKQVAYFNQNGKNSDLIEYLQQIEEYYGTLDIDDDLPSLYNYRGVAQHNAQLVDESAESFLLAATENPHDTRSWINLGEARMHQFRLSEAISAFGEAYKHGDSSASIPRLLRAKGWADSWEQFEEIVHTAEKIAMTCVSAEFCAGEGSGGMEYTETPGWVQVKLQERAPNSIDSPYKVLPEKISQLWGEGRKTRAVVEGKVKRRLKLGVLSSDFGVHPVATLLRGLIQYIDRDEIELYCFALHVARSWWGDNITKTSEHFIQIESKNTMDAALEIAEHKIDILIDLNGHTLHSGLPIMSHRPAPIQISYLGLPTSTGAKFIDFYIGDYVALPPELADHFSEKLILMPPCYIVNDYAQMRGGVLEKDRAPRSMLATDVDISKASFLFATFSNFQKFDPAIFSVWMNILRRFPGSKFTTIEYAGHEFGQPNIRLQAKAHGVKPDRLALSPQQPWVDHVTSKTAFDMLLDTPSKNGHTTGLDGIWAGVPTVALAGGATMPARAAESIAEGLESRVGMVYSLKEYEDLVYEYASNTEKLNIWREHVQKQRTLSGLFDVITYSKSFTKLMQATWEIAHLSRSFTQKYGKSIKFHIFSSPSTRRPAKEIDVYNVGDSGGLATETVGAAHKMRNREFVDRAKRRRAMERATSTPNDEPSSNVCYDRVSDVQKEFLLPVPEHVLSRDPLLLNIGGIKRISDWTNVNSQSQSVLAITDDIDVVRKMHNLYGFANGSVSAIYSSHTLEHAGFGDQELQETLSEWRRVLKPGGLLFVSVPDLPTLSEMYLDPELSFSQHWMVTRMMYGAQMDDMDYHKIGFDETLLATFLTTAGFCDIQRVGSFNLPFGDTSDMVYAGYFISLNIIARPCPVPGEDLEISIGHDADPYRGQRRVHSETDKM